MWSSIASFFRVLRNKLPILSNILLLSLGLYVYRFYFRRSPLLTVILLVGSTFSMVFVSAVWRKFAHNYADEIIHWTTEKSFFRKFIAGGSFSYYEFQEDPERIGFTEPILRFVNLLLAFIGIATSFANLVNLSPESPTGDLFSTLVWTLLIIAVPLVLTPIIPIIWTMEDLKLKAWNAKFKTNWRVSVKYKSKFGSLIAAGTLGVAYTLSSDRSLPFLENLSNFIRLLLNGVFVLTYPIAVLTLLYYVYFRGTLAESVKGKLDLPIAETRLVFKDERGKSQAERFLSDEDKAAVKESTGVDEEMGYTGDKANETSIQGGTFEVEDEPSIPSKIGSTAKKVVTRTGDKVVDTGKAVADGIADVGRSIGKKTVGRLFDSKKEEEKNDEHTEKDGQENDESKEVTEKKGGSATAGLWDD